MTKCLKTMQISCYGVSNNLWHKTCISNKSSKGVSDRRFFLGAEEFESKKRLCYV